LLVFVLLNACTPQRRLEGERHLQPSAPLAGEVPQPVLNVPPVPRRKKGRLPQKRFSAVVTDVPIRQLLFALARDAKLNLDLLPGVKGKVTINAIDQTLPQILKRLARQVNFRYRFEDEVLVVEPDLPYFEHYPIPYVNIDRDSTSTVGVSNQIGGGDANTASSGNEGDNESTTKISTLSKNHFWKRLVTNLQAVLGQQGAVVQVGTGGAGPARNGASRPATNSGGGQASMGGGNGMPAFQPQAGGAAQGSFGRPGGKANQVRPGTEVRIIAHPESGILSIKATARIHRRIRRYLDQVLSRSQRQVLIEATVVDVQLGDRFRAGVDWEAVNVKLGSDKRKIDIVQNMLGQALSGPPALTIAYAGKDIAATVKLLSEFGTTRVISSPRLMVVNNQSAILRVVQNRVYFTVEANVSQSQTNTVTTFETVPHTVPVGFVMSITPAIDDDANVLLHVRPTISRISGFIKDPNPSLADAGTESQVPEIEVQEMESMLRLHDGNIGIIGGLMQDNEKKNTQGVAGLANIPYVGQLFAFHDDNKTKSELVIFIRPTVIRNVSIEGDLHDYRSYLEQLETDLP